MTHGCAMESINMCIFTFTVMLLVWREVAREVKKAEIFYRKVLRFFKTRLTNTFEQQKTHIIGLFVMEINKVSGAYCTWKLYTAC